MLRNAHNLFLVISRPTWEKFELAPAPPPSLGTSTFGDNNSTWPITLQCLCRMLKLIKLSGQSDIGVLHIPVSNKSHGWLLSWILGSSWAHFIAEVTVLGHIVHPPMTFKPGYIARLFRRSLVQCSLFQCCGLGRTVKVVAQRFGENTPNKNTPGSLRTEQGQSFFDRICKIKHSRQ